MIVLLYITLIIIYSVRGMEQGILWSRKGAEAFKWNEHLPLVIVRIAIALAIMIGAVIGNVLHIFLVIVAFVPAFWFWHNTMYYYTRHAIDLNVYPNWFKAESTTSSAKFIEAMPYKYRIIGLGISLILIIILVVVL